MQIDVGDADQVGKSPSIVGSASRILWRRDQLRDELAEAGHPILHQFTDVHPQQVIPHFRGLIELEDLLVQMKPKPRDIALIPIKELRWPAAYHTVQRCHALLAVEKQLDDSRSQGTGTAM